MLATGPLANIKPTDITDHTASLATTAEAALARKFARDSLQRLMATVAPRSGRSDVGLMGRSYRRRFATSARAHSVVDGYSPSVIEHADDDDSASLGTFVARSAAAYDDLDEPTEFTTEYTMFGDNMSVRDDPQGRREVKTIF